MSYTIYDNIFRTIAQKMPHLFISLINEVFATSFSESDEIIQLRNEFMTKRGKIITDSIFSINRRIFHIECESRPKGTMAIRMFEYDFAIALEQAIQNGKPYTVKLPESCVMYLSGGRRIPDRLTVNVSICGIDVPYSTKVIKIRDYDLDKLITKKLLIILPYYMIRYKGTEHDFFIAKYKELLDRVSGDITKIKEKDIIEFICQVAEYLSPDEETRREVSNMGGEILELWSERVTREALAKGRNEGRKEGRIESIASLLSRGGTVEQAKAFLDATDEEIEEAKKHIKTT